MEPTNREHAAGATVGLAALVVATPDPGRALEVYRAVCGGHETEEAAEGGGRSLRLRLRNADVLLLSTSGRTVAPADGGATGGSQPRSGIHHLELRVHDPATSATRMGAAGVAAPLRDGRLWVEAADANGVAVALGPTAAERADPASPSDRGRGARSQAAHLDHVALRVRDLAAASARWEAITGVPAVQMGIHPVSGGAFTAARIVLGDDQMIELISPVEGVASAVAERLRSHGEGPHTVAIPAADLEATLAAVRAAGVEPLWRDPHWFVHPKDAAGVMIQLTPRVKH